MGQSLDREPIVAALAARLESLCPTFRDVTRRYREPGQIDASEKPLAIVATGSQQAIVRRGAPSYWKVQVPVYLYFRGDEGDLATPASVQVNALVKQVEDALERQPAEPIWDMSELYSTNLGLPNVKSVRLTAVDTDEGLLAPDGIAALLIEIEATP